MHIQKHLVILLCLFISSIEVVSAATYKLAIQPIIPMYELNKQYKPLLDYLSEITGHKFLLVRSRNFMSYWQSMKSDKEFDFVLDAAHFTDYRLQKQNYQVLAKIPDTVTFSLVTTGDRLILDVDELAGKKIATMPAPGLGAIRLEAMFPDKNKQAKYENVSDSAKAVEMLIDGRVAAAIIPTSMVKNYSNLNTITTTDPVPHMAFSSSPTIPADVVSKVKQALLDADKSEAGKKMLEQLKIIRFAPASNDDYKGYMELLKDATGY